MPNCIPTNHSATLSLTAGDLAQTEEYVVVTASPITLSCPDCTSIDFIPAGGPTPSGNQVTFDSSHNGTTYTLQYNTRSSGAEEGKSVNPLETPTQGPKFKPQGSC